MDESAIKQYITTTFKNIHVAESDGSFFFFYSPHERAEHKFPFVTLVTNDAYDKASDLSRPSVFRLNIGVSKESYLGLFGKQPPRAGASGVVETGHDFTTRSDYAASDLRFVFLGLRPQSERNDIRKITTIARRSLPAGGW